MLPEIGDRWVRELDAYLEFREWAALAILQDASYNADDGSSGVWYQNHGAWTRPEREPAEPAPEADS
jgi:hypothetical protein